MLLKSFFLIIQMFRALNVCLCYSSGAPIQSCSDMLPDHGTTSHSLIMPYNITVQPLSPSMSLNGWIIFINILLNYY